MFPDNEPSNKGYIIISKALVKSGGVEVGGYHGLPVFQKWISSEYTSPWWCYLFGKEVVTDSKRCHSGASKRLGKLVPVMSKEAAVQQRKPSDFCRERSTRPGDRQQQKCLKQDSEEKQGQRLNPPEKELWESSDGDVGMAPTASDCPEWILRPDPDCQSRPRTETQTHPRPLQNMPGLYATVLQNELEVRAVGGGACRLTNVSRLRNGRGEISEAKRRDKITFTFLLLGRVDKHTKQFF